MQLRRGKRIDGAQRLYQILRRAVGAVEQLLQRPVALKWPVMGSYADHDPFQLIGRKPGQYVSREA
jgi:hypothetical protein